MADSTTDVVWIDVGMWTGLSGSVQPFIDVECNPPTEEPDGPAEWQSWARSHLSQVADQDGWQPGRYHYTVERRDPSGRQTGTLAQDFWDWRT